ncbi:hypothetical protein J2Y45_001580 [Dyadobacter sp. BE34]|uniref:Uncharacterized protein n=1 Tax=Dyadobacter fermentans TaxID=94254 RepID=A0ABU1QT27_9BACT|nr:MULTISPECIES: hypothetical protein [Dyadobacter]MDR6804311.1 hypothetical protein [Dyadobacter fermentans]MDR7042051.1 hypothetical protein [Dyadobacter sp. BE242]MDR7196454.1 hypothetical protein [Dyadobacter sp. BE34]MDR7213001.1 hypothetical protein [Dyadobacter sp. BE31]MDR7261860.1 hypothetical protein [Dyadobacter sp. BE32]
MALNVNNNADSDRIQFTSDELEKLRIVAEKLGKEKLARIVANHPPEYWENYWNAMKRHRLGMTIPVESRS